ncbi:MAG: kinase, partial [Bacilli bacterium]|nr:kinase [Bacilli bacterium]
ADAAIHVERVMCDEAGGWQDQIAASFGGMNRIDFDENGYTVTPIVIRPDRKKKLNDNLMLFFTGFTRFSADVQKSAHIGDKEKHAFLCKMRDMVDDAQRILEDPDRNLDDFGRLLGESWRLKREMSSSISTSQIDELYEKGLAAGALGGKLLGAGGGGFLLFYVPRHKQNKVRHAMRLLEVPFEFEDGGTQVIYYTPEIYDRRASLE